MLIIAHVNEKPTRSIGWERGFKHLSDALRSRQQYEKSWERRTTEVDGISSAALFFLRSLIALESVLVLIERGIWRTTCTKISA